MQLHFALFRLNQARTSKSLYFKRLAFLHYQGAVMQCTMFSNDSSGSANCQKRPSTIRLRYPLPGTILAGTGLEKMTGYPVPQPTGTGYPVHPYTRHTQQTCTSFWYHTLEQVLPI